MGEIGVTPEGRAAYVLSGAAIARSGVWGELLGNR